MAERELQTFKLSATIEAVERGRDLAEVPHMIVLRWLHEQMPWGEFETRLKALFSQPDPFTHPDTPLGPVVGQRMPRRNGEAPIRTLRDVSRWPSMGVGALVRSLDGALLNDDFNPTISELPPLRLRAGNRIKFASVAVSEYRQDGGPEEVLLSHAVTNSQRKRS
jgi:hypothetical protein